MSALSMIRNNIGLVAVIIFISLLGFILTDLLSSAGQSGGFLQGSTEAGVVAGEKVGRDRYAERVDQYVQSRQNQFGNLTQVQRYQAEDDAWNSLVSEIVFDQELERTGIKISGDEVLDMFVGQRISPIVIQQFAADESQYDVAQVRTFLQNIQNDPDPESPARLQMKAFEDYLVRVRGIEQYQNAFRSGYIGSKAYAQQQAAEQNKTVDISFLGVNYTQIPDSTIKVSDSELRAYIADHPKEFEQEELTYASYVRFDVVPNAADSAKAFADLQKLRQLFADESRDSVFTAARSRYPFMPGISQPLSDVPAAIRDSLLDAKEKAVFGPILDGRYYRLYKVVEIQDTADYFANINHILVRFGGSTAADSAKALSDAQAIRSEVSAANFAAVATEKSQDFANRPNGGALGWYRKFTAYGEDFDKVVSAAPVGSIIGPIKSNQGYHVVQIVDKTRKTFSIANIEQIIYPSDKTRNSVYNDVNRLAEKASASGDLAAAAAELGLNALTTGGLSRTTRQVPGLQVGRQLVLWAIDAKVNALSKIIEVSNDTDKSFVYAQVTDRAPKGLQRIDDPSVRSRVLPEVLREKKAKIISEQLSGLSGDLNAIKEGYGAGAFVSNAKGITFSSSTIPGIGNDPLVIGTALGLEKGQQSGPIVGRNGVYIVKVDEVLTADPLDEATLLTRKTTDVITSQRNYIGKVEPALMELGDPKDTREQAGY